MKVFLDTNVFLEYFEQRREYQAVSRVLSAAEFVDKIFINDSLIVSRLRQDICLVGYKNKISY